ncbi:GNAT family N-acetyltransferase [Blastococcus sp. CCUG 61487]|uniref:GNAT family N-acetyltransferase n=1 Tax=Blastococcus sp. CCUG 61487 TaxID=1840703 RepID=UPI0010BFE975|nr:GNAT family N-acetyltransferase [Blastococcus sp. CCUG 61487]TKJ28110.1 hypothetical protein A6V29_03105 [Blastococcus sp. CCUG 61487]
MGTERAVVRDHDGLDSLADEWQALYADAPSATPFQSHDWVSAWARAYIPPGRLRVGVVRRAGRLVAAAPLYLDRRGPWPVLAPLGHRISDFSDVLVADDAAAGALVDALLDEPGWRVVDLPEVRPDAAALAWSARWPGRVTRLASSMSLELSAGSMEDVLARLPARSAKVVRRKLRKADELGIEVEDVPVQRVRPAVADMLRLHQEQWRSRGMTPEHGTAPFAAHLTEAMHGMVAAGQARVVEFRLGGDLVASQLYVVGPGLVGAYLAGIAPQLREVADVAALMLREDLRVATSLGVPRCSMMRGTEEYKFRWRPDVVAHQRLVLARPGRSGGAGFVQAAAARQAAAGWARARAPWLRDLVSRPTAIGSWTRATRPTPPAPCP